MIAAKAIIQDLAGHVLLVRRSDDDKWVMPAGSMELGESILDCMKREVKEETGLEVISAVPIAIYSDPRFSFVTAYGDPYQLSSIVFLLHLLGYLAITFFQQYVPRSIGPWAEGLLKEAL